MSLTKKITESFYPYKGYTIRIRCVEGNGIKGSVIKEIDNPSSPNGKKKIYLRNRHINFIEPSKMLDWGKRYIDGSLPDLSLIKQEK